jgi:hypothetical protein
MARRCRPTLLSLRLHNRYTDWCSGILLEMEGFALPLTDPIEILRDNDTITYI